MTHFKTDRLEEEWRKLGPFANPLVLNGPKIYQVMAHGRKDWPEPVLVAIVFSEEDADLMLIDHALGQQVSKAVGARDEALGLFPPKEAVVVLPY